MEKFKVQEISDFSNGFIQTFFDKLHIITRNLPGILESSTDDLDKSLRNIRDSRNEYGELQIAGEILACDNENIHEAGEIFDQVLFTVHFISTYVTFYKAEIPEKYWNELSTGLSEKYSVAIKR
ncbi:7172_t:CDS:2 [Racocetra persica]|uniref:7172_t:CDS:1 n=1 Tax=Racocetra persica TaxID=160502 RepID=A0ACA9MRP8_9GLOM|nr:7172_t:CDS:2 [Racocetra persica]